MNSATANKFRHRIHLFGVYLVLAAGAIILMIPFVWMISTALKTEDQVFLWPPRWIPDPIRWQNFVAALRPAPIDAQNAQIVGIPFWLNLKNTVIIVSGNIVGHLFSCSMVAFGFARLRARARDALFFLLISTMMLPYYVVMIPQFILFKYLRWVDTFLPLIVPSFFGGAFYIFLLRQFFMSIPLEMDDAARIDGCSTFQIYRCIILPLAKPALATVGIFTFMASWNDFLGPLIYLNDPSKFTLALSLNVFRTSFYTRYNLLMAASFVVMLPCLIIFFCLQRYFIQGVVVTGLKG